MRQEKMIGTDADTGKKTKVYTASVDCLEDQAFYETALMLLPEKRQEAANRMKIASGKRLSAGAGLLLMAALADFLWADKSNRADESNRAVKTDYADKTNRVDKTDYANHANQTNHANRMDQAGGGDKAVSLMDIELSDAQIRALCSLKIETAEHGKPYLPDYPGIHFNLSHSGNRVMCIVSDQEVGCDVEKIEERLISQVIRCFAESEQEIAKQSPENFFRIWTLKESILKLSGMGLGIELRSFAVSLNPLSVVQSFIPGKVVLKEYSDFRKEGEGPRYCCSCACIGGTLPDDMQEVDLASFVSGFAQM